MTDTKRGRRIMNKLRIKAKAWRIFNDVMKDPVGTRQAFLRGSDRLADVLWRRRKRKGPTIQEQRQEMLND